MKCRKCKGEGVVSPNKPRYAMNPMFSYWRKQHTIVCPDCRGSGKQPKPGKR